MLFLFIQEDTIKASDNEGMTFSDALPVQFWLEDCDTYNESTAYGVHTICWEAPWLCDDEIKIQFTAPSNLDYNLKVISENQSVLQTIAFAVVSTVGSTDTFFLNFSPLDYEICDQRIKFEVWSVSPDTRVAKSDYIDVRESHTDTKLISYTNSRNFSGLVYASISPDDVFYIRVRCRFFHERFPNTDEIIELTSSVATTNTQKKKQKLLEVEHAPYYFHNKMMEVLQHHTVTIENTVWKKEDDYNINEGDKRWPLKTATAYLTNRDSVVRNVI